MAYYTYYIHIKILYVKLYYTTSIWVNKTFVEYVCGNLSKNQPIKYAYVSSSSCQAKKRWKNKCLFFCGTGKFIRI